MVLYIVDFVLYKCFIDLVNCELIVLQTVETVSSHNLFYFAILVDR